MNFNKLKKLISEDQNWNSQDKSNMNIPNMNTNMNNTPSMNKVPMEKSGLPASNDLNRIRGNVNIQKLSQYLPSQDPMRLKLAVSNVMRGRRLNNLQLISLGNAFVDLLKASPQETISIMNLLKKASAEVGENQNEEV